MTTPLPTGRKQALKPAPRRRSPPRAERRVFVCDDDLEFADELASALSLTGFSVETLAGGNTVEAVLAAFQPHVILLDVYMPPPDGFEVLNILARNPRRAEISLILASGSGPTLLEVAARYCMARGLRLAGVFEKPVRLADIARLCEMPPAAP
jgi:CheY-like chemotaxis protein